MKRILLAGLVILLPVLAHADLVPPATGGISNTSTLQTNTTFYVSSGTAVSFNSSTATITHILGTTTNDNATLGSYGEYISSAAPNVASFPTSGNYGDCVSAALTAGDWDISVVVYVAAAGATVTQWSMGVGTVAGNDGTGLVAGDTLVNTLGPTVTVDQSLSLPNIRKSISGTTTYYLKVTASYSIATPTYKCRMSSRRIR